MKNLNFYFTGPLSGGHYMWAETKEMDQSFFKKEIIQKFENPNLIDSHYKQIAKHLESFYKSGKKNIETDVSGIIVPICHGDVSDYFHVAVSIEGAFEKDLREIWRSNKIFEEHPKNPIILEKRGNLTYDFMNETFNIPLFESYKFLPGYRETPFLKGKENISSKERISYVEKAFVKWVEDNFLDN